MGLNWRQLAAYCAVLASAGASLGTSCGLPSVTAISSLQSLVLPEDEAMQVLLPFRIRTNGERPQLLVRAALPQGVSGSVEIQPLFIAGAEGTVIPAIVLNDEQRSREVLLCSDCPERFELAFSGKRSADLQPVTVQFSTQLTATALGCEEREVWAEVVPE